MDFFRLKFNTLPDCFGPSVILAVEAEGRRSRRQIVDKYLGENVKEGSSDSRACRPALVEAGQLYTLVGIRLRDNSGGLMVLPSQMQVYHCSFALGEGELFCVASPCRL